MLYRNVLRKREKEMQPMNKISKKQHDDIQRVILNAARATTKELAMPSISLARSYHSQIRNQLDDYVEEQLNSAITYAENAAGRVKDKERKLEHVEYFLYKFKSGITLE